jgi:glycosyltransferase involved in cell wall biosynthesis
MRIAFIVIGNSRRSNYLNGYNLRYGGGGGSGTDTSSILVAEYLAKQGHEVVFVIDRLEPALEKQHKINNNIFTPGDKVNGVSYTYNNFEGIENLEFDILVNMLWFNDYEKLPIKITKKIIYWSHMQWIYGIGELNNYAKKHNLEIDFVHISNWEKEMTNSIVSFAQKEYSKINQYLIPNPIMDDVIKEVINMNIPKKKNKFIFHASWARGGNVAYNSIKELELENKEMHVFDYLMTIHDYKDNWFYRHDGVDKKTLFMHLAESEYFIYPLYTPYQDVHKDTFSCVVAEAIALGCIVVTYPLGALPENFNDYCQWLEFPKGINPEGMQKEALSKDLEGKFKITQNIIDKINYLESNPQIKENIRQQGKDYILNNFNINDIGKMWEIIIN